MRIPVGDNTAYIFKLTPHTTMKDKLASYNHLIETFVIVTETFLCGLLFLLFSKLSNEISGIACRLVESPFCKSCLR